MTKFENEIRQVMIECVEAASDNNGDFSDERLCEYIMNEVPYKTLRKIQKKDNMLDLDDRGFANMCNILRDSNGEECEGSWGYWNKEDLLYFEASIEMDKDGEYVGDIIIRAKYNSTEDCDDLIKYKFVPDGVDEETVEFTVFHG